MYVCAAYKIHVYPVCPLFVYKTLVGQDSNKKILIVSLRTYVRVSFTFIGICFFRSDLTGTYILYLSLTYVQYLLRAHRKINFPHKLFFLPALYVPQLFIGT